MRTVWWHTEGVPAIARWAIGVVLCLGVAVAGPHLLAAGNDASMSPDPQMVALPAFHRVEGYWLGRPRDLDPFDNTDLTAIGTVQEIIYVREVEGQAYGMEVSGYLTRAKLALDCAPTSVGDEARMIFVEYFTPRKMRHSFLGREPYALKSGARYLLLLRRAPDGQTWEMIRAREDGPPPTPLAAATSSALGDASAMGMITSQLVASAQSGDEEVSLYAIPVLGYLAQFKGRSEARAALIELAEGTDEATARVALRALTWWGWTSEELAGVLSRCTSSDSPMVSGAAIAARLRVRDASAFADLVAWCSRPGLNEGEIVEVESSVYAWPGELVTDDTVREVAELLDPSVPARMRVAAVQLLLHSMPGVRSSGGTPIPAEGLDARSRAAPLLMSALDDPDLDVRNRVVHGLYTAARGWQHPELRGYAPTYERFSADPDHYTDLWKAWWQANGEALPEPPPPPPPPPPPQFVR